MPRPRRAPAPPRAKPDPTPYEGEGLEPEGDYDTLAFTDLDLSGERGPGARFMDCVMVRCTLNDTELRKASFRDVRASEVRTVGADLAESSWLDVAVENSLLAGAQVHASELRRVTFRGDKIDYVNFRVAWLTDVCFEDCVLREPDFGGATLTRVSFPGSRLVGAELSKATLRDVDLRGCEVDIARGYESLRGAVIDSTQLVAMAPILAAQLGLEVRDD